MEPIGQPSTQPTEDLRKGKRRRRGCGWLLFLALAAVVVTAVVMFGRPSRQSFDFLANAKHLETREFHMMYAPRRSTYSQTSLYRIPKPFKEVAAKVKQELFAKGFRKSVEGDSQMVMSKTSIRTHVVVTAERSNTLIHVAANGDATLIDRARLWIKDRISPKETASQSRIKAMTGGP